MKPPFFKCFASLAGALLLGHAAIAQTTLFWDADGAGGSTGGTGTWDTTSSLWRLSNSTGSLQTYLNTGNATTGNFSGTAGTVTIAAGTTINANRLTFGTTGYTIAGADATSFLNLDGTTPTISGGAGNTTTISARITGSAGLTKANDTSTLILSGNNSYSGITTISGGNLVITDATNYAAGNQTITANGLGASSIALNSGTLRLRANGQNDATAQTLTYGNNMTVGGTTTIDIDRQGGTGTNKTLALGTLSIGAHTLNYNNTANG